ncbi:phenylalanine--tRNA ligase subunit beta [Niabella beijingensis]|uniref:phenylalanine--tRNA ligase subunit beta n=1 Tax=Niabella beijingensis TaxID=2872700 RepID=UPI001CBDA796|nr:phenylalanine--tRNA ligase subunit beta [Niabella beijingensis]MBZ4192214.1 phenylalanine--tRNA ligase subunit beta [Niabella beijingensis]
MIISYKWLSDYLPVTVSVERLSQILTSIGLEVEAVHEYEELKGGLKGLVVGEVLETHPHPNADKLKLTKVTVGGDIPLNIVCGAPNVAAGQKVIVAPVGATIYPLNNAPVTMKLAKIRGEESQGMICAEDEIGLGASHDGILVLPDNVKPGTPASEYFQSYSDMIFEIGLTPNRMDAMSHWGVARDVCAYLSHHDKKSVRPKLPETGSFKAPKGKAPLKVTVENKIACPRYSGICIDGIKVGQSPKWLQHVLKAIGLRPINNIVDITNFIQHETGQPLHAFDADKIRGNQVIVKNLPEGTTFITLDEKERKLSAEDLMICDAEGGMCIGGVFGGLESGVTDQTARIFLESACFDPVTIRKTSFRHGLRTDAATRFEKGTDISATVNVLKRATGLILEICGGSIASDIYDLYPDPQPRKEIALKYHYLKKLSGKNYHPDAIKSILQSLGFEVEKDTIDALLISVPYHKPDIRLQADLVEEILRIDGLDNVEIPTSIKITPSVDENIESESIKEKIVSQLIGSGHQEILTNSITNNAYYSEQELTGVVKMKNSLSAELNIMRPDMLETGLEIILRNLNRKNENLRLFEFGKTYIINKKGNFEEPEHLCIYLSGNQQAAGWKQPGVKYDFFALKGIVEKILQVCGISGVQYDELETPNFQYGLELKSGPAGLGKIGAVHRDLLDRFYIKQPVFYADLDWNALLKLALKHKTQFSPIPRFPGVQRDIAMIAPQELPYRSVEAVIRKLNLKKLQSVQLFDVFVSDKLGAGKKSLAINFTFLDEEKTLTDVEIDGWMKKIMQSLERDLQVEIRK